jgi:hypothetical protein
VRIFNLFCECCYNICCYISKARNIWFDMYEEPWSSANQWLKQVGGDILQFEKESHNRLLKIENWQFQKNNC